MKKPEALEIATRHNIPLNVDFHSLDSGTVARIVAAADERKYREPKNANGSRARYFFYMLARASRAKVPEYVIQQKTCCGWEDETTETNMRDCRTNLKAYRTNAPGLYRVVTRRVPA